MMTPAEQKEAEANGAGLKEVKSEISSDSSSEDIPPFQKRSRRKECIYITIAVVLGAGLIAVLVYFSVTNALKEDDPVARENTGNDVASTTPEYPNYDYQMGYEDDETDDDNVPMTRGGAQLRNNPADSGPSLLRKSSRMGPADAATETDSGSSDFLKRARMLPSSSAQAIGGAPTDENEAGSDIGTSNTQTDGSAAGTDSELPSSFLRQARFGPGPSPQLMEEAAQTNSEAQTDGNAAGTKSDTSSNDKQPRMLPKTRAGAIGQPISTAGQDEAVDSSNQNGQATGNTDGDTPPTGEETGAKEETPPLEAETKAKEAVVGGIPDGTDRSSLLRMRRRRPEVPDTPSED